MLFRRKKEVSFPKSADVCYIPGSLKTIIPYCRLLIKLHAVEKIPSHLINGYMGGYYAPNKKGWFISPIQLAKAAISRHRETCKVSALYAAIFALASFILMTLLVPQQYAVGASIATYYVGMVVVSLFIAMTLFAMNPVGGMKSASEETTDDQGNSFSRSADFLRAVSKLTELLGENIITSDDPKKLYLAAYDHCTKLASDILLKKAAIADRRKSMVVSANHEGLVADESALEALATTLRKDHDFFVKEFDIDHLLMPDHFYQVAAQRLELGHHIYNTERHRQSTVSTQATS